MNYVFYLVPIMAYLLGSIPFGLVLVRVFCRTDIRQIGSGNIGATNVMRTGSRGLGIITLLLDAAKGYLAVFIAFRISDSGANVAFYGYQLNQPLVLMSVAALAAILGHIFPVWLKFKGGKGVATGVGSFVALAPKAVLVVLVIFVALFLAFRYVSLGSIAATAAFPIFAALLDGYRDAPYVMPFICFASLLIIAKHHQNIRRLISGTEHRLEFKHR